LENRLNRRSLLTSALLGLAAQRLGLPALSTAAAAEDQPAGGAWRHGVSLFGDLKYPEGFKHFDYVNAAAPKGGTVRQVAIGTFDNFNIAVAGVKGNLVAAITLIYDTLLATAFDEVASEYALIAEAARYPDDHSSASYRLRAEAKWHDGKPITPADVIFSFNAFRQYSPQLAAYYRHVRKVEQTGEREITFTFDGPGNRELPQIVGELFVLPKHWWEGTDSSGKKRDVGATTLEPPLGSGPYRIKSFSAGRDITYERVPDYWARALNVRVGRDNFDELRFIYFRDTTVALEAFKGDAIDYREENSAKDWATAYDFPAVKEQRVVLEQFPITDIGLMQAFAFNIRRDKFKDPRVRLAFNYAFDFDEMNRQLFFGQYKRISSYFDRTELAATGLPTGRELEILQPLRDKVPPEVFTTPYANPVGGSPDAARNNLRQAVLLLRDAGYEIRNGKLANAKTGEPYAVEFLIDDPGLERVILFYKPSLDRLGITATIRTVDDAQYQNRLRAFDFDITTNIWAESLSPGNEQRDYWGSQAADVPGSSNLIGIKNPAVDELVNQIIFAKSRDDLVAAARALDRVLLWNHYVVPQWTYPYVRSARWDRFSHPALMPKYGMAAFPMVWWWDQAKAAKTATKS
jgi:microcin C transport system substrate-binding protein